MTWLLHACKHLVQAKLPVCPHPDSICSFRRWVHGYAGASKPSSELLCRPLQLVGGCKTGQHRRMPSGRTRGQSLRIRGFDLAAIDRQTRLRSLHKDLCGDFHVCPVLVDWRATTSPGALCGRLAALAANTCGIAGLEDGRPATDRCLNLVALWHAPLVQAQAKRQRLPLAVRHGSRWLVDDLRNGIPVPCLEFCGQISRHTCRLRSLSSSGSALFSLLLLCRHLGQWSGGGEARGSTGHNCAAELHSCPADGEYSGSMVHPSRADLFLLLLLFRFSFCLLPSAAPDAVDGPAAAVLATDPVPVVLWHGESPHARAHLV